LRIQHGGDVRRVNRSTDPENVTVASQQRELKKPVNAAPISSSVLLSY
jgi:hypothetical protein